jgi:hypothetical protein
MFGTIRRHQSWLWIIIAAVTILSFVVYFGPNNNKMLDSLGRGGQSSYGTIAGQAITRQQFIDAKREVDLGYFLQYGQLPDQASAAKTGFYQEPQIYQRLFMIQKMKELGVDISQKAVVDRARAMLGPMSADEFVGRLKTVGFDYDDFERLIRHEIGMQQLVSSAAVSGKLVTPQEADALYRNEHQDLVTSAAFFSASNYVVAVAATPTQISQFYTNQLANYRIPQRVEVSYVKYNVTNYLAAAKKEVTNIDEIISQNPDDQRRATNAESRAKVTDEIIRGHALQSAMKEANQFATALFDLPAAANRVASFDTLAAKNGLTVKSLAPFDEEAGPKEIEVSANFNRAAFKLTADEPFSPPIPAEDGIYVLALKRTLPSEIPPLATIEARVKKDYETAKATQMAQEAAIRFHGTVTNGLAQHKSFAAICAEAGVKPELLPPFSVSTQSLPGAIEDRIDLRMLKQAAFTAMPGQAARPMPTRDGACVLYVEKQLPVDEAKMKADFPKFLAQVRQGRQSDAFNQWFQKQVNLDPDFRALIQKLDEDAQKQAGSRSSRS